jgi:hypothetical protein
LEVRSSRLMKQGLEKLVAEKAVSAVGEATAQAGDRVEEATAPGTEAAEASIAEMEAVTFMTPREVVAEAVTATEAAPDAAPPAREDGREGAAADAAAKIDSSDSAALSAA